VSGLSIVLVGVLLIGWLGREPGAGEVVEGKQKGDGAGARKKRAGNGTQHRKVQPVEKVTEAPRLSPAELARLQADFVGPLADFPPPPTDAPVLRVSRSATPGPSSFRSLSEAWGAAVAGRHTIIEIRDNGPLFEPAMRAAVGRSLTIRAAPGYRPLIAWQNAGAGADRFLTVEKGSLTLEGLDLVANWTRQQAAGPAGLVAVTAGNLAASGCTFSVANRQARGFEIIRLDPQVEPVRCRLSRCFVRGPGLTALAMHGAGADVLLDGCLVVSGGEGPLLDVLARADSTCTLRLVRSTLVAGQNLLHVACPASRGERPAVGCLCWDTVLTRAGAALDGEMVRLSGGATIERLRWKAVNAVHAGWEKLLASAGRELASGDAWRQAWGNQAAGEVVGHPWPALLPAALEECEPSQVDARTAPGFPSASAVPGPVGCDLTALPAGRPGWQGLTYERFVTQAVTLPDDDVPPEIPPARDRRYHGGRVTLDAKTPDLGQFLRAQLQNLEPGPRVVLHVSGSGNFLTSPLQLRGADLVLYFERAAPGKKPLTLLPNPRTTRGKAALIEVEGGNLEMTGARVVFENSALATMPLRLVRVQGGQLRLFDCHLQGPLTRIPPEYLGAIQFEGSGKEASGQAHEAALNRCVVLSGRSLLTVRGAGARLLLHECAFVALGDALRLEPGESASARRNVICMLRHSTVAARRAVVYVRDAPKASPGVEPAVVQADDCVFLDPFPDMPPRGAMLVYEGDALARGLLLWQGKSNGYDARRLQIYAASEAEPTPGRQTHADWVRLWGKAGEQQEHLVPWPATPLWTMDPDHPQLERLRLPPTVRLAVGANPSRLKTTKNR
jgi:hypothetical protein